MEQLPAELLYHIISRLDGHSLGCASGVNRQWRSIVTDLGSAFNIWFHVCWKEIGVDWIIAQTGMTWLATEEGLASAQSQLSRWTFWRDLFAANFRCWRLDRERWEEEMEPIIGGNAKEDVVAADIHPCGHMDGKGKFVVGYRGGDVYHFSSLDMVTALNVEPHHGAVHISAPSTVAMLALGGSCPGYDPGMKNEQMVAVSSSEPGDVIFSSSTWSERHPLYRHIVCISSLGEYLAIGGLMSQQNGIMVYRTKDGKGYPVSKHKRAINCKAILQLRGCLASRVQAVALAYNQVVGGDKEGNLYCWEFKPLCCVGAGGEGKEDSEEGESGPERIDEPSDSMKFGSGIEQVVILQHCVVALTDQASMYVIKKTDWSVVRFIDDSRLRVWAFYTNSVVVRLAGCGHLLAVGFSSGEVVVLNTSARDWNTLQSWHVVSRFRCPLTKLVTLNFSLGPKGPELLVAGDRIFACKWRRRKAKCAADVAPPTRENLMDLEDSVVLPKLRKLILEGDS